MWYETDKRELVLGQMLCLEVKDTKTPFLGKCHEMGGNQEWQHKGTVSFERLPLGGAGKKF